MAEYIERSAGVSILRAKANMAVLMDAAPYFEKAAQMLEKLPAADVAPVVRCKDCKHLCVWNRKDIYAFCPKTNIVFLPFEKDTRTFFCGFGERKDGGAE